MISNWNRAATLIAAGRLGTGSPSRWTPHAPQPERTTTMTEKTARILNNLLVLMALAAIVGTYIWFPGLHGK